MLNLFIKAEINESAIYIKVNSALIVSENGKAIDNGLLDTLHDSGYTVSECTPDEWDNQIEYGNSYEIDDEAEVEEFKEINIKLLKIKHNE